MADRIARVLSIAGSDSGGGAGIQADLKAFAAAGVHGMTAITAITAQNTLGVSAVHTVPPRIVVEQVRQVATDIGVDAVKIGMLATAETIDAVAEALVHVGEAPVVLDPVMVAESGAVLLDEDARAALIERLVPRATVITPNLPEAKALVGGGEGEAKILVGEGEGEAKILVGGGEGEAKALVGEGEGEAKALVGEGEGEANGLAGEGETEAWVGGGEREAAAPAAEGEAAAPTGERDGEAEALARALRRLGPRAVVVTGGHRREATDVFFDGTRLELIPGERHPDGAAHGSGCTHSSTLAAWLARGADPLEAARRAKQAAAEAVRNGLRDVGAGAGPVDVIGLA